MPAAQRTDRVENRFNKLDTRDRFDRIVLRSALARGNSPDKEWTAEELKAAQFKDEELTKLLNDPSWDKIKKEMDEFNFAALLDESRLDNFSLDEAAKSPPIKIGTEGERKVPAQDVARWMSSEVTRHGILYQSDAARHILRDFGGGFLSWNQNNNLAIDGEVLREFWQLTFATVGWVKSKRYWRLRRVGDPPNKREVDE